MSPRLIFVFIAAALGVCAAEPLREFHPRGGWPNVAAKLVPGGEVRVAFLGGSITAADGWRPLTLARLQRQYPRVKFTEFFAAAPGACSEYRAARLQPRAGTHLFG